MNINLERWSRKRFTISGKILLTQVLLLLFFTSSAGGAAITFDKALDVPDRDFTVTYEGSTFSFTIADIGNYKIGEDVGVTVSGGVKNMRLVLFTVDKLTPWFKTFYGTSGSVSAKIPAERFDPNCPDVCDDESGGYKMGPGIYALAVQNRDDSKYFIAKPIIVSEYDMTVTPSSTQNAPGSNVKVTVQVFKKGIPVNIDPDNVKIEFVQDSTSTHFTDIAQATSTAGVYEANIPIPPSASGNYKLYAAIITNRNIYQDYPEIIGAASYSGTITFTNVLPTPSPTPASPFPEGGGNGQTGEELKNIDAEETYEKHISKDAPTSYAFKQSNNPISEIVIISDNTGNVFVKTEILRETSSMVSSPPPGVVYKNVNIWGGIPGSGMLKNIKEALIKFRVENSWFGNNNTSDIKMVRWDGSRWVTLETEEKTKDSTYTYYEAKISNFSVFAITRLESVVVPTSIVKATPPEVTVTSTAIIPGEITTVSRTNSTEKAIGFEMALALATLLAVYIFERKKR